MILDSLRLRNFKGIRDFVLKTGGGDVEIFADNGQGKTTLFDAFTWLLYGKNSQNQSDFEIKTLDKNGEPLHGLDHEVEGIFSMAGNSFSLRRVYSEIWTKKRGSATKEFTGHTTSHFIDGVPVKKNEYEGRIAGIVDEDAFKLLTNPRHFNEILHWQERRKILLEVCGDVQDDEVISSDNKLRELPNILQGRSLEDHRKIILAKRTEINGELQKVPIRIDETERGLPEPGDKVAITASLADLRKKRNEEAQSLVRLESGGAIAEETKKLRELEVEMLTVEKGCWVEAANKTQLAKGELRGLQDEASGLELTIKNKQRLVADNLQAIGDKEKIVEELRKEWEEVSATVFTFEDSDRCPTCGQSLPAEKVLAAKETALAAFNANKAQRLEDISNKGKMIKSSDTAEKLETKAVELQIAETETQLAEFRNKITDDQVMVASLEKQEKDYATAPAYIALVEKKAGIEQELNGLKNNNYTAALAKQNELATIDNGIGIVERDLAQIEQRESGLKRIEELKLQERKMASEYERLEQELFLTEQFVRAKVTLLSEKVNSKFGIVRFKMFSELVNGGIEDCCITLVDGVPYPNLNHGGEMAAGLDIISTLGKFYGLECPIWIDNSESFCHLPEMSNQMIKLIVSADDKALRVDTVMTPEERIRREVREQIAKVKEKEVE